MAIFGLALISKAQVPNYVPASGLVGWWPFNGNANDESGNGNNGLVNGATLTNDRFGSNNSAYNFTSDAENINCGNSPSLGLTTNSSLTISYWTISSNNNWPFISKYQNNVASNSNFAVGNASPNFVITGNGQNNFYMSTTIPITWVHLCFVYNGNIDSVSVYLNGNFIQTNNIFLANNISTSALLFGPRFGQNTPYQIPNGNLDDIGIWNRALTQQEITDLYNGCQLSVNAQPNNQTININNNAQFIVGSSDALATYQWQTDLGVGFQNLNNVGQYSGTANDTLDIANVTLSNNSQPFRCIISSGSCTDTSNVAVLTVNNNTGINQVSQSNLFSVYPNPANSQINVKADAKLLGSVYTIYDNTGKLVLTGKINSDNTVIELGNLSGGIYLFSVGENLKQTFKVIKE